MDLFDSVSTDNHGVPAYHQTSPLAVRMRPASVEEVVGQEHLLEAGSPVLRLINPPEQGGLPPSSVILWGPPGTGKTTLAYLVARASGRDFVELSAVTAGVKDLRAVIENARRRLTTQSGETILFIDEVHRFSKTQQDALLPAVENRWVTLIAATTENPSFSVISPLLSRSILLTLRSITDDGVSQLLTRALEDERGLNRAVSISEEAREYLVRLSGGDARKALTIVEAAAGTALSTADAAATGGARPATTEITMAHVEQAIDVAAVRYDRAGDQHYDVTSAFIKSMRGSDVDAALHYMARMIAAGEDPRFIARRIVIAAAEEVGMADPTALQVAVAAAEAVQFIGMPEGALPLAQAVVHIASAPKSNAAYKAIGAALADVRAGKARGVPTHLRDTHYAGAEGLGHGVGYEYAHDAPHAVGRQQYLPDELVGAQYYRPSDRGYERAITERLEKIDTMRGRRSRPGVSRATPPAPADVASAAPVERDSKLEPVGAGAEATAQEGAATPKQESVAVHAPEENSAAIDHGASGVVGSGSPAERDLDLPPWDLDPDLDQR